MPASRDAIRPATSQWRWCSITVRPQVEARTGAASRSVSATWSAAQQEVEEAFGVLPFTVPCPVEPASGFQLYDRDLVRVETIAGTLQITDPAVVARYS